MAKPFRRRWLPPLIVFAAIYAGYYLLAAAVIAIDPFDLYPWGKRAAVSPNIAVTNEMTLLPRAIADPEADLLVVGGSTSAGFSAAQLRQWIPSARHPLNLSYGAPSTEDSAAILRLIARRGHARRVILFYNLAYILPEEDAAARSDFPMYLVDGNALNDLRAINPLAFRLAWQAARTGQLHAGSHAFPDFEQERRGLYHAFQTPASIAAVARRVVEARPILAAQTARADCAAYPSLEHMLGGFADAMAARGARVDIVMANTSRAFYAVTFGNPLAAAQYHGNIFARDLASRRCLVRAMARRANVRVFAFDDEAVVGDLANYRDSAHLENDAITARNFAEIDRGGHQLTVANVDAYVDDLRRKTIDYRVRDSRFPGLRF